MLIVLHGKECEMSSLFSTGEKLRQVPLVCGWSHQPQVPPEVVILFSSQWMSLQNTAFLYQSLLPPSLLPVSKSEACGFSLTYSSVLPLLTSAFPCNNWQMTLVFFLVFWFASNTLIEQLPFSIVQPLKWSIYSFARTPPLSSGTAASCILCL